MARKVTTRWKITGILNADTPLHIGGVSGDADTDLALAVNGRGKYYVPGTSLAGALRSWMTQIDPQNINQYWGFQQNDEGHASFIIVDDAEISLNQQETIEIREGVGIDRYSGTAANKGKYNRAIIPKGATFSLNLTFDSDSQDGKLPDSLIQLLQALEKGDIRLGAAKTRGLGRIKLTELTVKAQDLASPEGIFNTLLDNIQPKDWDTLKKNVTYQSPPHLSISITWNPVDPVMVKAEGDGLAIDILPLVSQVGSDVTFVIPGSSIKGVLRSQAERIVRTVCQQQTSDHFLDQVRLDLINELFGSAARGETDTGKIGALSVDDCFAKIPINPVNWSAVENAKKMTGDFEVLGTNNQPTPTNFQTLLRTALTETEEPYKKLQPAMHVAVDRWTGGAAEGMLYNVLEPIGVTWDAISLQLDLARLQTYQPEKVKPAITLLILVLRDLADKKIPIGYGTNRGMGTISVSQINLEGQELDKLDKDLKSPPKTLTKPDLTEIDGDLLTSLNTAWKEWIDLQEVA